MKKCTWILTLFCVIALLFAALSLTGCDNGTGGGGGTPGLEYELLSISMGYRVSGGTVMSGAVVIPATYNGLPVIWIAEGAFYKRGGTTWTKQ